LQFEQTVTPISSSELAEQLLHEYIYALQDQYTAELNACFQRSADGKVVFVWAGLANAKQAKTTCLKIGPYVIVRIRHTQT